MSGLRGEPECIVHAAAGYLRGCPASVRFSVEHNDLPNGRNIGQAIEAFVDLLER